MALAIGNRNRMDQALARISKAIWTAIIARMMALEKTPRDRRTCRCPKANRGTPRLPGARTDRQVRRSPARRHGSPCASRRPGSAIDPKIVPRENSRQTIMDRCPSPPRTRYGARCVASASDPGTRDRASIGRGNVNASVGLRRPVCDFCSSEYRGRAPPQNSTSTGRPTGILSLPAPEA